MVIGLLMLGGILFSYYGFRAWFIVEEEKRRHRAEEALRKSEENYRLLFESATEGILIAQDGMIKVANQALAEILKYPRDLLLEKPFPYSFIRRSLHCPGPSSAEINGRVPGNGLSVPDYSIRRNGKVGADSSDRHFLGRQAGGSEFRHGHNRTEACRGKPEGIPETAGGHH
jgi:PAS domain-containing protein